MRDRGTAPALDAPGVKQPPTGKPDAGELDRVRAKGRGKSRARLFGRAVLLLLAGALALGVRSHYEQHRQATIAAQQHRDFVPSVRVGTVITRDFGREVEVSDGVKNDDEVILNPPVDLQEGSKVQARAVPPEATP